MSIRMIAAAQNTCVCTTQRHTIFGASSSIPVSLASIEGDSYRRQ